MTNCIRQPLLFSSLKSKKIQADFNGGTLTSDAGALLLREADKRIGLLDAINNRIPDPRNQFFIAHQQQTMLAQHATDEPVHGNQDKRFFHGYYASYCFLPLYVFCGSQLLVAYLRPADIDPAMHSRAILKLLVKGFRQLWPNVRIVFRGDSGFCRWRLMRWCDRNDIGYIIGLARNQVLERLSEQYITQSKKQFEQTGQKQRIFGEFMYSAATWDCNRRVIVKAEHLTKGANTRFIVTNLYGKPQELYDELYCKRGDAENRIKEQQLCLFSDRTSCHDFVANQFRVLMSAAAYILTDTLRREALCDTELANAQVDTIRLKLLKIGAQIVCSVRRIVLHLAGGFPFKDIFAHALSQFCGLCSVRLSNGFG
jgi:hypothetical protein